MVIRELSSSRLVHGVRFVMPFTWLGQTMPAGSWLLYGPGMDFRMALTHDEYRRRFMPWLEAA